MLRITLTLIVVVDDVIVDIDIIRKYHAGKAAPAAAGDIALDSVVVVVVTTALEVIPLMMVS